jgi:hypothetical protein
VGTREVPLVNGIWYGPFGINWCRATLYDDGCRATLYDDGLNDDGLSFDGWMVGVRVLGFRFEFWFGMRGDEEMPGDDDD